MAHSRPDTSGPISRYPATRDSAWGQDHALQASVPARAYGGRTDQLGLRPRLSLPCTPFRTASPSCTQTSRTHVFVKFLRQLLDVPQYFLLVPLFCTHALHFISHKLEEEEMGERRSCGLDGIWLPFPYPGSIPGCNATAGVSQQIPGSVPRGAGGTERSKDAWDSQAGGCCCQTATYLIKQVD